MQFSDRIAAVTAQQVNAGIWPSWPFTKLSETDMGRLLQKLEEQRWEEVLDQLEDAPW